MSDFTKKINYDDYKQSALEGFLMSCPEIVRKHILLCTKCQESLDPMFELMFDMTTDRKLGELVVGINEEIIEHIQFFKKLNKGLGKSLK